MKNLLILCLLVFTALFVSCTEEECIQCTLVGTATVCEDSIDVFNAANGTNAQSLDDVRGLVRTLGGTCSN